MKSLLNIVNTLQQQIESKKELDLMSQLVVGQGEFTKNIVCNNIASLREQEIQLIEEIDILKEKLLTIQFAKLNQEKILKETKRNCIINLFFTETMMDDEMKVKYKSLIENNL